MVTKSAAAAAALWLCAAGAVQAGAPNKLTRSWATKSAVQGFDLDGQQLVSCGRWGDVALWDISSGGVAALGGVNATHNVTSAAISGGAVAAGAQAGTGVMSPVYVWDVAGSGTPAQALLAHNKSVTSVAMRGSLIASGSMDTTVVVWDRASRRRVATLKHASYVTAVAISPDGQLVAGSGFDKKVSVWSAANGWAAPLFSIALDAPVGGLAASLAFSADGSRLIHGDSTGTVRFFDLTARALLGQNAARDCKGAVASIAVRGNVMATGCSGTSIGLEQTDGGVALLWDLDAMEPRLVLNHNGSGVRGVRIAEDGSVMTGAEDKLVRTFAYVETAAPSPAPSTPAPSTQAPSTSEPSTSAPSVGDTATLAPTADVSGNSTGAPAPAPVPSPAPGPAPVSKNTGTLFIVLGVLGGTAATVGMMFLGVRVFKPAGETSSAVSSKSRRPSV